MSGHKWTAAQRRNFTRTMKARSATNAESGTAYVLIGASLAKVEKIPGLAVRGRPVYRQRSK